MKNILITVTIVFLSVCCANDNNSPVNVEREEQIVHLEKETNAQSSQLIESSMPNDSTEFFIYGGERSNIYLWKIPEELNSFKSILPKCQYGIPSCAACGYCAYIKLSDDWSIFAYEVDEFKWYRKIDVYENKNGKCRIIQHFTGFIDSVIITDGVYKLLVAEGSYEYYKTDYRFLYTFTHNKFIKGRAFSDTTSFEEYQNFIKTIKDEQGEYGWQY